METGSELQGLLDQVSKSLIDVTRASGQLAASDVGFLRTSKPKIGRQLDKSNTRLLQLTKKLLQSAVTGSGLRVPDLSSADEVEDNWRGVVDVIDNLLEKTDLALDECTGVIKRDVPEPEHELPTRSDVRKSLSKRAALPKPQLQFHTPTSNANDAVFKPLLHGKPHAAIALQDSIRPDHQDGGRQKYKHPYQAEIEHYQYPSFVYEKIDAIAFTPLGASEATFVDTLEGVEAMLDELKEAKEIAIDLEHHDKHSYIGLVSLMQISTRDKDWVVDTLKPWRQDLQMLNEVFADPSILKVLHGAYMDIIWLQRDLGLYIVGLFDTYHASNSLRYPGHSLAFLLDKFANFKAQKQFQLADWRVRPLPKELYDYARSDTHFLLNIYDHMRNELVEESRRLPADENPITHVLEKSKEECLQNYEHSPYDVVSGTGANGWYNMLIRTPALFTRPQFAVFLAVHQWRDSVARTEDESQNYVMPKQTIFNVARVMPEDLPALHGCAQPISDIVRDRVGDLLAVVRKAKAEGENGPDMKQVLAEHPDTIVYEQRKADRLRLRRETQPRPPSVAEVLQRERQTVLEAAAADVQEIATQTSQFWGPISWRPATTFLSSAESGPEPPALMLDIPLPPLQAAVPAVAVSEDVVMEEASGQPKPTEPATNGSEIFVLHDLAKAKKRKASTQDPDSVPNAAAANTSDATGAELTEALQSVQDDELDEERDEKRARKVVRKAEKERKKVERMRAEAARLNEQAFDYANAPSVLNAGREGIEAQEKAGKAGARPYTKAMDAPKGMPKVKRELKGKSMTFKN